MAAEKAQPQRTDPLTLLGHVDPPSPDVLENARERLWLAVNAEMLALDPADGSAVSAISETVTVREHGRDSGRGA
jgi:hypothetical protein